MPVRGACVALVLLVGGSARAQDRFEIQVYDSETAPPGEFGVEHHLNVVAEGRTTVEDGELPTDHVFHLTFEPHIGLARWCEVGAYLQTAVRPDGELDYAGVKLRYKVRFPRRLRGVVGLALNAEISSVPAIYESNQIGGELRPIVDVKWRRLWASVNPIVTFDFRGAPRFDPAAALMVAVGGGFSLGAEYYGSIPDPQAHRLFGIIQWDWRWLSINTGVGYGFVASDDRVIVKMIVGVDLGSISK
jgi:hypothetical protein